MRTIELQRDRDRNVRFTGEKSAQVSSYQPTGSRQSRWVELTLYRTNKSQFVCQQIGVSLWKDEYDRYTVFVADDAKSLVDQVGTGWLAKKLYDEAGIDYAADI